MGAARLTDGVHEVADCSLAVQEQGTSAVGDGGDGKAGHMYLVSLRWWTAWERYTAHEREASARPPTGKRPLQTGHPPPQPGPIDNSPLLTESGSKEGHDAVLKADLKEGIDYKVISKEDWERLQAVHGGGIAIKRPLINSRGGGSPIAEVYKLTVTVVANDGPHESRKINLTLSVDSTLEQLKEMACKELDLPSDNWKMWDYFSQVKHQLLDDCMDKSLQECNIIEGQIILLESSTSDRSRSDSSSSETNMQSPTCGMDSRLARIPTSNPSNAIILPPPPASATPASSRFSTLGGSTYFSDTVTTQDGAERGFAGLSNLGNTCFMNSSLQCLTHTPAVVSFFLSNSHQDDINTDNPLGMHGELAEAFGMLMASLWQGNTGSVAPRGFKAKLAHFAPQFSGYSQQDSQELLAFLLDGLHEDLNRIKNKPYIEDRDSDGRPDEEVAAEAWSNYRKRNNSVVVDHFQGLYKSCLVCPDCGHSSIKFDPFMYLSLPLPTASNRTVMVTMVATDGSFPPTQYCLSIPKLGTGIDLQQALHKTAQLGPDEDTVIACIFNHRVHKKLADDDEISLIRSGPGNALVAYRRPRPPDGAHQEEVHIFHRRACNGFNSLFAAPLLLWFPSQCSSTAQDTGRVAGVTLEDVEKAIIQALRPFRQRSTRRAGSSDSMGSSSREGSCGKDGSAMMVDPAPTASASDGCPTLCRDASGDETTSRLTVTANSEQHVDVSSSTSETATHMEASGNDSGQMSGPRVEPFDMWESTGAQASKDLAGASSRATRKRSTAYRIQKCNEFGVVNSWSTTDSDGISYYVLEWESDVGDIYNPSALETPVMDESVQMEEIAEEKPLSLESCLECFLQHEKLDLQDSWYCPKCKDHVQADKKLDLWSLPEVLVVHLKRFSYNSRLRDKLTATVDFPLEGLDLNSYVLTEQKVPPIYDLYAVSNHMGGLGGGHYTAYVKHLNREQWYCFDDSRVYPIEEDQVVSSNAYMLFYQRRTEAKVRENQVLQVLNSCRDRCP